jgi:DNA-binding transcriptional LysR family regulator
VRLVRVLLRGFGWLLTPLVAWAASFFGAWLGAWGGHFLANSTAAVALAVLTGAAGAVAGTLLWMRLLRGSPRLRAVLAVTGEGVPKAAIQSVRSKKEVP